MAIRTAIAQARASGTRRWIIPEHVEGPRWPVNPVKPEVSWPMFQTFTPNAFLSRWRTGEPVVIDPQLLRDIYQAMIDEDLGALRWYEEPFYAKWYYRECSALPDQPSGLLTQLIALLRRAFVAVDRTNGILNYYNIAGDKVDDVDIPPQLPGPPGRRGSLWFTGVGPPSAALAAVALGHDMYLDLQNGNIYQFLSGTFHQLTTNITEGE